VRLRVVKRTDAATLRQHVRTFTHADAEVNTDEWVGYSDLKRKHVVVAHGLKEWARDDDGDGIREVHVNTMEGTWTTVRNFLRPFRGVHKQKLGQYIAVCEFSINLKKITPAFIKALVTLH
jgi:transposase-like protein